MIFLFGLLFQIICFLKGISISFLILLQIALSLKGRAILVDSLLCALFYNWWASVSIAQALCDLIFIYFLYSSQVRSQIYQFAERLVKASFVFSFYFLISNHFQLQNLSLSLTYFLYHLSILFLLSFLGHLFYQDKVIISRINVRQNILK